MYYRFTIVGFLFLLIKITKVCIIPLSCESFISRRTLKVNEIRLQVIKIIIFRVKKSVIKL